MDFRYGGNFVLLVVRQAYNIDYNTGVFAFKTALAKSGVVAFMRNTTVGIVYDGNFGISLSVFFKQVVKYQKKMGGGGGECKTVYQE
jgi:hypothetical protein